MWLFGRSNTAESDNSDLKEVTHAQRQRNKQIEWLREKVNGVTEIERDKHYRVSFSVPSQTQITLDIVLSERFPFEAPLITAAPFFVHPWVNQQMVVIGSPLLQQFNPHCNLGDIVKEIVDEIGTKTPPSFDRGIAMATQPQVYPPPQMGNIHYPPAASMGGSLLDTPFSFSSAPHFSQTANIQTPPPVRSGSSSSPTSATPTTTHVGPYAIPATLPGLSEKTEEQLTKYLKDEDAVVMIDRFISRLDVIKNIQQDMEKLFVQNEEQSRANMDFEPELQRRYGVLQEKFLELNNFQDRFDGLYHKQIRLLERYDRKQVYQHLKSSSQDADANSDIIAEDFLSNKMESSTFLQTFLRERKLYHLRSIKTEMLKHNRT